MNADLYDNMQRIERIDLTEWKRTVSLHEAWLWCRDLIGLIKSTHYEIDRADVMFGEGNLRERVQWLRERMEAAEAAGGE